MNFFGKNIRVEIFGESHGPAVGVVIDGVKPGIPLTREDFAEDISRRKSGSLGTTPRLESDDPEILSGVFEGHTTGAPIAIMFRNTNTKSSDYEEFPNIPRPGHADWTASVKWGGMNDPRGGGHFSGRLTLPLVAAGVVAKKQCGFSFKADLVEIGGEADKSKWDSLLAETAREGDSLGGVVECQIEGVPAGLGEPFFDSVESLISHAVFSIPGVRGIEFGDGFTAARMKGSDHNDPLVAASLDGQTTATLGTLRGGTGASLCEASGGASQSEAVWPPELVATERPMLAKNGAGGVNGGITNGAPVVFRVAFKPTSSIAKTQKTLNVKTGEMVDLNVKGRHDVCFALRTPVIVEAVSAIVLAGL